MDVSAPLSSHNFWCNCSFSDLHYRAREWSCSGQIGLSQIYVSLLKMPWNLTVRPNTSRPWSDDSRKKSFKAKFLWWSASVVLPPARISDVAQNRTLVSMGRDKELFTWTNT